MITPASCARMIGMTCLQAMTAPRRLIAQMRSNASSVISASSASCDAEADVVVQHVDAAPTVPRFCHRVGERRLLGDVGLKRHAFAQAALRHHGGGLLGRCEPIVDREHLRALLREAQHGGAAVA